MADYTYEYCRWLHNDADYPVELWSELDSERWEIRKVERWADGRLGRAAVDEKTSGTGLAELPLPMIEEIATDPEFQPRPSSRDEFESWWKASREADG